MTAELSPAPAVTSDHVEIEVEKAKAPHSRGRATKQSEAPAPPGTPAPPAPAVREGRKQRRLRESSSPGRFAIGDARTYKRFWRDVGWAEFLEPCPGGFAEARQKPPTVEATKNIQPTAGLYEFAVSLGRRGKKIVVYVGESTDLHRRHHNDYRGPSGSHLKDFFEDALKTDLMVWRRLRYLASKEEAVKWEAFCLGQFDYAWNKKLNVKVVIAKS